MSHCVYIGIGSNLDNPLQQVKSAILELNALPDITVAAVSGIYKSKPLEVTGAGGGLEQADYINAVICINTLESPEILLDILQALELKHNRVKQYHWGPRSLDLDILLYDNICINTERLTIPHTELVKRDFVVHPLNDIAPGLDIPRYGKLEDLLATISKHNLVFVEHYKDQQDTNL